MSVMPRSASASMTRGSLRSASSHSWNSSTVMLGWPSSISSHVSTASPVSETRDL